MWPWGESWRFSHCVALEWGPVWPCSCRIGGYRPPVGDSFDMFFKVPLAPACWAQFLRGNEVLIRAGTFGAHPSPRLLLGTEKVIGLYCCGSAGRGHMCLPPAGLPGTTPNSRLFWSVLLSPGGFALLCLLLYWGWLAAPKMNLQCAPPGTARWFGSGVGNTFLPLNA